MLFEGIFAVLEFIVSSLFDGITYDVMKYLVALYFSFLNIFAHYVLHGYHTRQIHEHMRICGKHTIIRTALVHGSVQQSVDEKR